MYAEQVTPPDVCAFDFQPIVRARREFSGFDHKNTRENYALVRYVCFYYLCSLLKIIILSCLLRILPAIEQRA